MSMKIKLEVLDSEDEVIGFSEGKIAVKKNNGELEIFTLLFDDNNIPRIDDRSVLITFKTGSAKKSSIIDEDSDFEVGSF